MAYLVLAKSRFGKEVLFLTAHSLSKAKQLLPRFTEDAGYMTLWRPRWATKKDTIEFAKEFKQANIQPEYEFKSEE